VINRSHPPQRGGIFVETGWLRRRTPGGCNILLAFRTNRAAVRTCQIWSRRFCTPPGCDAVNVSFYKYATPLGCGAVNVSFYKYATPLEWLISSHLLKLWLSKI